MITKKKHIFIALVLCFTIISCREDEIVSPTEYQTISGLSPNPQTDIIGLYVLNEGAMGTHTATLDLIDYRTATYARNFFAEKNPTLKSTLGDVGNDIQIYNNKVYAVINCSNKVVVIDAHTGVQIAEIEILNCRHIQFKDNYAYVSAYDIPVMISKDADKGAIYKIDLRNNTIVDKVKVGYQPEELVILENKLYVANSGGYRAPNYDNTVSVVNLNGAKMRHESQIESGINLDRMQVDRYGKLWVSSRGDYRNRGSNLYVLDKVQGVYRTVKTMNIPCSNMAFKGDSLYTYSVEHSEFTGKNTVTYSLINVKDQKVISRNFITDGSEKSIEIPYGIAIHPRTKDIYITDATSSYVARGQIHCYDITGRHQWSVKAGNIPAHMAFLNKK